MAGALYRIPFNRPAPLGRELDYIRDAIEQGQISGDGVYTKRCHALLEQVLGARRCLLTTSATHALDLSALLLDLGPGDEVILPSFTFVSTANAVVLRGARPVFADIREDTLNLDEALLAGLVGDRTRAIFVVHYAGVSCELDPILELARAKGLRVVEDAAQALGSRYRGRPLGTLGDLGCISFHETKNVSCGEGGALVVNDAALVERAEIMREKGTNRSQFFRGQVDRYTWVDAGSSFLPSDLLAAFLFAQLQALAEVAARRRAIHERYAAGLADLERRGVVRLPRIPAHVESSYHLFYLLCEDLPTRDRLTAFLKARGIQAVFHYVPLHDSPMARRGGFAPGSLPVTERLAARLLRLPFYNALKAEEQDDVIRAIHDFYGGAGS
ncbi:MAG: dTDP-4-amino-4,6-dideoxygalactose transaminase [Deltaproteobacteria bacterium]|nr:dTDP-4-amino-4,6-dideoxygalactose transaminase [Deltaproteobacteria bacterium]